MHPILFTVPAIPAWVAALLLLALGGLFWWMGRRDKQDKGSAWLAGACAVAAIVVFAKYGKPAADLHGHAPEGGWLDGRVGPFPIHFFGILVVLGFLAASKVAAMRNRARNLLDGEQSFDLAFYVLLAGIAGSRMLFVMQNTDRFAGKPLTILYLQDGGLVWYGGAFAGALYAWYWLAKNGKDLWAVSDSLALGLPVGQAVGRIGCFMAGCDYGTKVEGGREALPWAVHFPYRKDQPDTLVPPEMTYDPATDKDVYLHPTQIYLLIMNLCVFALLFAVDRRAKGAFRGRLTALYLILYAIGRSIVENWRGDADRGVWDLGLVKVSFSQFVSVLVLGVGIWMYRLLRRNAASSPPAPPAAA